MWPELSISQNRSGKIFLGILECGTFAASTSIRENNEVFFMFIQTGLLPFNSTETANLFETIRPLEKRISILQQRKSKRAVGIPLYVTFSSPFLLSQLRRFSAHNQQPILHERMDCTKDIAENSKCSRCIR